MYKTWAEFDHDIEKLYSERDRTGCVPDAQFKEIMSQVDDLIKKVAGSYVNDGKIIHTQYDSFVQTAVLLIIEEIKEKERFHSSKAKCSTYLNSWLWKETLKQVYNETSPLPDDFEDMEKDDIEKDIMDKSRKHRSEENPRNLPLKFEDKDVCLIFDGLKDSILKRTKKSDKANNTEHYDELKSSLKKYDRYCRRREIYALAVRGKLDVSFLEDFYNNMIGQTAFDRRQLWKDTV